MEKEELLKEAKNRRKNFLKEMPDDQRRLLKMHQKTVRHAKSLMYAIPGLILILIILYFAAGFYFRYEKRWLINGIILVTLCLTAILAGWDVSFVSTCATRIWHGNTGSWSRI